MAYLARQVCYKYINNLTVLQYMHTKNLQMHVYLLYFVGLSKTKTCLPSYLLVHKILFSTCTYVCMPAFCIENFNCFFVFFWSWIHLIFIDLFINNCCRNTYCCVVRNMACYHRWIRGRWSTFCLPITDEKGSCLYKS